MKKIKILVPALLSIAACGAIVAGSTYALFTSEAKTNVAITSGKVNVTAVVDDGMTLSHQEADAAEASGYKTVEGSLYSGTATLDEEKQTITIDKMLPMDQIAFTIKVKNESNVAIKYRTIIMCEVDNGLFDGLTVRLGEGASTAVYEGKTTISAYASLAAGEDPASIPVTIEMGQDKGEEYEGKSCTLSYKVEAVQGNASVPEADANLFEVYTTADLRYFQKHSSEIKGTVKLINDLDLGGAAWTPIEWKGTVASPFTFDGNGKTISNYKVSGEKNLGLFGYVTSCTIKDLTIDNASVKGIGRVGALVGQLNYACIVADCKVTNSTVTAYVYNNDDGDKAGALIGSFHALNCDISVTGCAVENCVVTGYRDIGGLSGCADYQFNNGTMTVANNAIKDTTIIQNLVGGYKSTQPTTVGEVIGRQINCDLDLTSCTTDNVKIETQE